MPNHTPRFLATTECNVTVSTACQVYKRIVFGSEKGSCLRPPLRNLRGMQIARYSFRIRFRSAEQLHEFPHKCSFLDASPLVGRVDHFCSWDRGNMPASFGKRREPSQACRAEQEERIAVAGSEDFVVWAGRPPTIPVRGRDRQRARLSGRASEAPRRSRHRAEPAAK